MVMRCTPQEAPRGLPRADRVPIPQAKSEGEEDADGGATEEVGTAAEEGAGEELKWTDVNLVETRVELARRKI